MFRWMNRLLLNLHPRHELRAMTSWIFLNIYYLCSLHLHTNTRTHTCHTNIHITDSELGFLLFIRSIDTSPLKISPLLVFLWLQSQKNRAFSGLDRDAGGCTVTTFSSSCSCSLSFCVVWENWSHWQHPESRLCEKVHPGLFLWGETESSLWHVSYSLWCWHTDICLTLRCAVPLQAFCSRCLSLPLPVRLPL